MQLPLFVYGTLKPGESNYAGFLEGQTSAEHPARISGAELYTEGMYPYLVVTPGLVRPAAQVYGMLMTLRPEVYVTALARVDGLEDYIAGNPNNWYERIKHPVQTDNSKVTAWIYVAGPSTLAAIRAGRFRKIPGEVWSQQVS